jgi:hypothetical protein
MTVHPVTVQVYGSLYPGKWSAALGRVSSLGNDSGEPLVASRQIPSGGTYHFTLAAGRYVVAGAVPARPVTVTGGEVTTVKNSRGQAASERAVGYQRGPVITPLAVAGRTVSATVRSRG